MRFLLGFVLLALSAPAIAAEKKVYELTISEHRFNPAEINVPAGEAFTLKVKNLDATPEEFESHSLKVEKVITGKSEAIVHVRALKPGTYEFEGEFNPKTAQGVVIAE
ncbi:MAG: cupredoxin domain-containing protein [Holosporales bacterium]